MKKFKLLIAFFVMVLFVSAQNRCLNFDGVDDYVDLGNKIGNSNIRTIEMWFKPDVNIDANSNIDYTTLIGRNNIGENCEFGIYFSEGIGFDGKLAFTLNVTNGDYRTIYSDQASWSAGTWYHVAATVHNADGMKLYINGVLQSQTNTYSNAPCFTDDITTLGTWGDAKIRYFNGSIDEVRLWNYAKTQSEILANKNHELTGSEMGLIAYYNFNQGLPAGYNSSVTTLTESGNNFNGELFNLSLQGNSSNWLCSNNFSEIDLSNALNFDGVDDYVDLGNKIGNSNIRTIEMWFKPDVNIDANSNIDYTTLIGRNNIGENCEFGIYFSEGIGFDGKLAFTLNVTNGDYRTIYSDQASWSAGTWYHVAATVHNADGMKLYINGVLQSQTNTYSNAPCFTDDITTLGAWGDAKIRFFNGSIDEVRIWNYARTQSEISTNKNHELTGSEIGLIAYYNFNQGESGGNNAPIINLIDLTSNTYTGELFNFNLNGQSSNWICSDVSLPTNTIESVDFENVVFYPNPTNGNLYVTIENEKIVNLQIYNLSGKVVYYNNNHDITQPIDLNHFSEGLYFIVFSGNVKKYTGKVIVQSKIK